MTSSIRVLQAEQQLYQADLADRLGVSRQTVNAVDLLSPGIERYLRPELNLLRSTRLRQ